MWLKPLTTRDVGRCRCTSSDVVDLGPLSEGWRVQRDTPGYGPDLDADQLREAAAGARRYHDMH